MDPSGPGASPRSRRVSPRSRVRRSASHSIASCASVQRHEPRDLEVVTAPAAAAPLVHERRDRDLPALVERPDEVRLRHGDVVEEDLVEVPVAVHEHERTDGDPGRSHVEQQVADPGVLRRVRVRPRQHEHPVGEVRARCPDLLAVHDEVVAAVLRPRAQAREIRAGAGLGIALAPDVVGSEDPREEVAPLRLRPPVDDGRPGELDARVAREHGPAGGEVLLLEDRLLQHRRAAAAVLARPRDADPA
jgi:hypothetical protein